ncbi:unnamed protein product [Gordionus sp. m RMFG-2023]
MALTFNHVIRNFLCVIGKQLGCQKSPEEYALWSYSYINNNSEANPMLKAYLTEQILNELLNKSTNFNCTLADCIRSGYLSYF